MKILAITNNSREASQFSSIEISAQPITWNNWRMSIKGALSRKSPPQGILDFYVLGKAAIVTGNGNAMIRESQEKKVQYSIISIPYVIVPSESYQVQVLLDVNEPFIEEGEPFASIYLGDKRLSREMTVTGVWENSVQIKSLKFQLLYPGILPASYIRPLPKKIAQSTEQETKLALREYFGNDILGWGIKKWLVQDVDKNTPFTLKFPALSEIVDEEMDKRQEEDFKSKSKRQQKKSKGCRSYLTTSILVIAIIVFIILLSIH